MKAVVNIDYKSVEITHIIDASDLMIPSIVDYDYDLYQKDIHSDAKCVYKISFEETDEWRSIKLFDGRIVNFHYNYLDRTSFKSFNEWLSFIFKGYDVTGGKSIYNENVVEKVSIEY